MNIPPASKRWRVTLASLSVLSLLFPTLLSLLQAPAETAAERTLRLQFFAALCHAESTANTDRATAEDRPTPSPQAPFCPICLAVQLAGSVLLADASAVPMPVATAAFQPPNHLAAAVTAARNLAPPARAPPFALPSSPA